MKNKFYYLHLYPTKDIHIIKTAYKLLAKKYHPDKYILNNDVNLFYEINDNYKFFLPNNNISNINIINNYYNEVIINEMYDDLNIYINIDINLNNLLNGLNTEFTILKKRYYYENFNLLK